MAQGALGHLHLLDVQQIKHGAQYADPSANDGAPFFLEAFQADAIRRLGAQQAFLQPVEALAGDDALGAARSCKHVANGASCAG